MSNLLMCCFVLFSTPLLVLGQTPMTVSNQFIGSKQGYAFIENKGQVSDQFNQSRDDVLFYGSIKDKFFYLKTDGVSYQRRRIKSWSTEISEPDQRISDSIPNEIDIYRVDIDWIGHNSDYVIRKGKTSDEFYNFYLPVCRDGVTEVRSHKTITYESIYDGVDLKWHLSHSQLKYDYYIDVGANYKQIKWKVNGADKIYVRNDGSLIIETPAGLIEEGAPVATQGENGVTINWVVNGDTVGFEIEDLDTSKPLIIDPLVRLWSTYYGGSESDAIYSLDLSGDYLYACGATGSKSNIATVGSAQNTIPGNYNALLAKFNTNGTRLWATYYGGPAENIGTSCNSDKNSNIYMYGYERNGTNNLATSGTQQTKYGGGRTDAFLAKFNEFGKRIWTTYCGGKYLENTANCIIDDSNYVYICGTSTSDTGIATVGGHQSTGLGPFLIKYAPNGKRIWGTYYGADGRGLKCYVDDSFYVYLSGQTISDSLIASKGCHQEKYGGQEDLFVAKFDNRGVRQWGTYYGGIQRELLGEVVVDKEYNVYLTGSAQFHSSLASSGSYQEKPKGQNIIVIKFNRLGVRQWATYFGGEDFEVGKEQFIDDEYNLYICGYTRSKQIADSSTLIYQSDYAGGTDCFLAKFDSSGHYLWATYFGGSEDDFPLTVKLDQMNNLYLAGVTSSTNKISTQNGHQKNYAGNEDGFIVKFCQDINASLYISSCDEFVSPSGKYTYGSSGVYYDTLSRKLGCDSILTIHLKILKNSFSILSKTVCGQYISPSGKYVWDSSGTYVDTILNYMGCDSIMTISLASKNTFSKYDATTCDSLRSPSGKYYWKDSGEYSDTLVNMFGCDSIVSVTLKVFGNKSNYADAACDSYVSPSGRSVWTESGMYIDTLINAKDCDSLVFVDLTIYKSSMKTIYIKVGERSPSGEILKREGKYFDTIPTMFGCDSIFKVIVERDTVSVFISDSLCSKGMVLVAGRWFEKGGEYSFYNSANDTLYTLHLFEKQIDTLVDQTSMHLVSNAIDAQYQWLKCEDEFNLISGEQRRQLTPRIYGQYAVEISKHGCVDTSRCYEFFVPGIYPNPTEGPVTIDLGGGNGKVNISVYDAVGRLVQSTDFLNGPIYSIHLNGAAGIYFIQVSGDTVNRKMFNIIMR